MKLVIVVISLALAVNAFSAKSQWESFKVKHNKSYRNEAEETYRYAVFLNNLKNINEHNEKYQAGLSLYKKGVNQFADLTQEELRKRLGLQTSSMPEIQAELHEFSGPSTAPDSIDWRNTGAVVGIKDQGFCGSCWAYGATGALEGQNYIKNNVSVPLSEQELIDCSLEYGPNDCDHGGEKTYAFNYVADHGIQSEEDYPYEETQKSCRANDSKKVFRIQGYKNLSQSEDALKEAVGTIGPIAVSVYAEPFMEYESGIFDDPECVSKYSLLDHSVVVVGYGTENGTPFWIIRNSWGTWWGNKGYMRIKRGVDMCGISLKAVYPVV